MPDSPFDQLTSALTEAVLLVGHDQRICKANHEAYRVFGYPPDTLPGQSLQVLIPERFAANHPTLANQFTSDDTVSRRMAARRPICARRADGSEFPAEVTLAKVHTVGEEHPVVVAILRDTSEQAAEAARERQRRERAELSSALASIVATTPESEMFEAVLQLVREAFQSPFGFFGYIDDLDGSLVCPSMTHEVWDRCQVAAKSIRFTRDTWGGLWGQILVEQRSLYKNSAHRTPPGHIAIQRSLGSPIVYQGKLIGSIHVANRDHDYTDHDLAVLEDLVQILAPILNARLERDRVEMQRAKALAELAQSQRMLSRFIENASAVIYVKDLQGRYTLVNHEFERLLGKPRAELIGRTDAELFGLDTAHAFQNSDEGVVCEAAAQRQIQQLSVADQSRAYLSIKFPLLDASDGQVGIGGLATDVTEQQEIEAALRRSEERLRASLQEKEVLLQEIHHRVKNNLQIVSSLLRLQANRVTGDGRGALLETENRVRSMALVHERLYRDDNPSVIDFAGYLRDLVQQIARSYDTVRSRVAIAVSGSGVELGIEAIVPCGLIVTELVTNSFKHGFPDGRRGRIHIQLSRESERIRLVVADDGVSMSVADAPESAGLGLKLVKSLVAQLDGTMEVNVADGTTFSIGFADRRPAGAH